MKKSGVQRIYMLLILIIVLGIFELELMVNYPQQWIELIGVGCLIIFVACLIAANGNSIRKEYIKAQSEQEKQRNEEIQNVAKAEKANYLLIKKNFADLEDKFYKQEKDSLSIANGIEVSERKLQKYMSQMIEEEKKIARISVGRSKEYSETVIKANEELKDRLAAMEKQMADMANKISVLQDNLSQNQSKSLDEVQYQKLFSSVSDSEEHLKSYLDNSLHNIEAKFQEAIRFFDASVKASVNETLVNVRPEAERVVMEEPQVMEVISPEVTEAVEQKVSVDAIKEEPEMTAEEEPEIVKPEESGISEAEEPEIVKPEESGISETEESEIVKPEESGISETEESGISAEASTKLAEPQMDDPNKMMDPDDIDAILASIGNENNTQTTSKLQTQAVPEPEAVEAAKPQVNKEMIAPEPAKAAVNTKQNIQSAPVPEPVKKPEPKPDLSDPNKMMGPDDIAALLAEMNGGESGNAKPKPSVQPKPTEAPKPLQPADPNKVMSPDEIAALIAGL